MEQIECRNCKGSGTTSDVRYSSITHRRTEVARKCRFCAGTGVLTIDTRPIHETYADHEIGDIPEWMLGN